MLSKPNLVPPLLCGLRASSVRLDAGFAVYSGSLTRYLIFLAYIHALACTKILYKVVGGGSAVSSTFRTCRDFQLSQLSKVKRKLDLNPRKGRLWRKAVLRKIGYQRGPVCRWRNVSPYTLEKVVQLVGYYSHNYRNAGCTRGWRPDPVATRVTTGGCPRLP